MSPQQNAAATTTRTIIARIAPSLKQAMLGATGNAKIECGFYDGQEWKYVQMGTVAEIKKMLLENDVL